MALKAVRIEAIASSQDYPQTKARATRRPPDQRWQSAREMDAALLKIAL